MNLPPMTVGNTDDPEKLAWDAAYFHKQRPQFDDGWTLPNGPVEKWISEMLADGKVRHVAEQAAGFARIDPHHPSSQVLRALVPFLREVGNRKPGSGKRGPKGRMLTTEQAGVIEGARFALWLAIYARLLLKATRITRADAECFLTYFHMHPDTEWRLGSRNAADAIRPHAETVLRRYGLEKVTGRNWKAIFRDAFLPRLEAANLPGDAHCVSYLRDVTVELDT